MPSPATVVVIGASAGGVEALRAVVAALPDTLDAAVFVTLHIGMHPSELPFLLERVGTLPASHAVDGEVIRGGHIFVAPPDQHLTLEPGRIVLTRGPRENMARPAIDPMFRSAAGAYGEGVIGVILSGGLNDGTAGMIEIGAHGGTTIVQDPASATSPSMPRSAIEHAAIDHVVDIGGIGALLARLVAARSGRAGEVSEALDAGAGAGAGADHREGGEMTAQFTLDQPIAVTCPDCGGALRPKRLGPLLQFACHIGHVYTLEVMMAAQFLAMERFVEQAMRSLSERADLCRVMAEKTADDPVAAARWAAARTEASEQTAPLRALLTREWLHPVPERPAVKPQAPTAPRHGEA